MPNIILADGKQISFDKPISGLEIASKISKSLEKEACVMSVDGELKDLNFSITKELFSENLIKLSIGKKRLIKVKLN